MPDKQDVNKVTRSSAKTKTIVLGCIKLDFYFVALICNHSW